MLYLPAVYLYIECPMKKLLVVCAVVSLLPLFNSCKTPTSPGSGGANSIFFNLRPGSRLIYEEYDIDPTNTIMWRDTVTDSVLATHLIVAGKTNVIAIGSAYPYSNDFAYYALEPNGDLSVLDNNGNVVPPFGWITIPCGSQSTSTWRYDTTIGGQHLYEILNMSGAGIHILTAGTQIFPTKRVKIDITATESESNGQIEILNPTVMLDVSPDLGLIVKEDDLPTMDDGKMGGEHIRRLVSVQY